MNPKFCPDDKFGELKSVVGFMNVPLSTEWDSLSWLTQTIRVPLVIETDFGVTAPP